MAEGKPVSNIGAGAGNLAKLFQKSMNRAQEKVLQKLGKNMETKDEQFEECCANLNKQQTDGTRLFKDVKAYHSSVKAMHEASKRLSQTLNEIYEPEWDGAEELLSIMESQDLLWNDFEEKLSDQVIRTMENYSAQFPDVKERVAKRCRKLVDFDSARHHLESLQNSKKKDDAKISKAEEEFNKSQEVFEDINKELREELPALYQSRIGCYVTTFQNISSLRDVFYKEMSLLNHSIYDVMKKLEEQHSTKLFIVKGLDSMKSKKRKSLTISAPVPCNTAFPPDHRSNSKSLNNTEKSDSDSNSCDSEANTPKRQSYCSAGEAPDVSNTVESKSGPLSASTEQRKSEPKSNSSTLEKQHKTAPIPIPRQANVSKEEQETEYVKPPGFLYKAIALVSQPSEDGELLVFKRGDVILMIVCAEDKPAGFIWGVREQDWIKHSDLLLLSGIVAETMIQRITFD